MVVYLGLVSLLLSGALVSAYAVTESAERNRLTAQIHMEGTFILDTISVAVDNADIIEHPSQTSELRMVLLDTNTQEKRFYLSGSTLILEDAYGIHPLSDYIVKELAVERFGISGSSTTPEYVAVSFTLHVKNQGIHIHESFNRVLYLAAP